MEKSVDKLKTELSDLQKKAYNVGTDVCNLSEVISSIQASAQTQENRIAELENFQTNSEEFINEVIRIDNNIADTINQNRLTIDDISFETSEEPTAVYNFKVEDYHTYFVGIHCIFVHNAECTKQQVLDENRRNGRQAQEERHNELLKDYPETQQEITIRPYDDNGNLVDYNVRADEINNDFFNEVKATETAPYTRNQRKGCELLQRNGGEIRGSGKPGFEGGTKLGPTPGYTTRSGKTVPLSQAMAIHGGGK